MNRTKRNTNKYNTKKNNKNTNKNSNKKMQNTRKNKKSNLQNIMNIPGLSSQITKHLSIPNVKSFRTVSRKTRNNNYIKSELVSRKEELSNESIDKILENILFINEIPDYRDTIDHYYLNEFVGGEHFDDQADIDEMKEMNSDYDSDDEEALSDYRVEKYMTDFIMIEYMDHPPNSPKYIIYCPHFKSSDLQTLNTNSFSNSKSYERFRNIFNRHFNGRELRIYRLLPEYDSKNGGYERIKQYTFKKSFGMIA